MENGIELLPEEITKLLILWLCFKDRFDDNLSHKNIKITTIDDAKYGQCQKISLSSTRYTYFTAICKAMVEKGCKMEWTFRFDEIATNTNLLVGIVNDESAQAAKGDMCDFSDSEYGGFGLFMRSQLKYHGANIGVDFAYGDQFEYESNDLITMKLDLTQEKSQHGILSCIMHSKVKDGVNIDEYSNVLWDDIDVNQKWRATIAMYKDTDSVTLVA